MATSAEQTLYPFSTRSEEAIPLDIIDPVGLIYASIAAGAYTDITLPAGDGLGHAWSERGCLIQYGNTLTVPPASGVYVPSLLLVPPNMVITSKFLVGNLRLIGLAGSASNCYIQLIRKWNSLALSQNVRKN